MRRAWSKRDATPAQPPVTSGTDWQNYGNTTAGTRYVRLDQLTPDNVGKLQKIWHYRTGRGGAFKATPIQIGDLLYACTGGNVIVALDAETGERRWRVRSAGEGAEDRQLRHDVSRRELLPRA